MRIDPWDADSFAVAGKNISFAWECEFYFLLTLLDRMFDEAYLSKMAGLIKSFVEWTLKTLTGTVAGLQVFQSSDPSGCGCSEKHSDPKIRRGVLR